MGNISTALGAGYHVPPHSVGWSRCDTLATIILFLAVWFLVSWVMRFPDNEGVDDV
jgi:hypothetical protein